MAKRLFIGGLPYDATDAQLSELFAKAGTVVSVNIIIDKFSGRSKGFAFVEMTTDEEAQKAIETLNGTKMGDRSIIVNEARPLEERPPRQFDGPRGGGDRRGGTTGAGGGKFQKRW